MAIVVKRTLDKLRTIQPEYYSDFLDNFEVDLVKQDLFRNTNEEAVKTSIRNLLLTNRGERLYKANVGSDIRAVLFENFSPAMESVVGDLIKTTVENYEPRARIIDVVVASDIDEHFLSITIIFNVINREAPVTLELILNRIR